MATLILVAVLLFVLLASGDWTPTQCGYDSNQITEWGKTVTPYNVLPDYPRPQMRRDGGWMNLNGLWNFTGETSNVKGPLPYKSSAEFGDSQQILVPFPAESCLSGIGKTFKHLSYMTRFNDFQERDVSATRVLLQFGAVDWQCSVYLNGKLLGNHTGGYDSFTFDITDFIQSANNELMVSVYDPSDSGFQPNGKQRISAITKPGGDTYTPSSGIWQTVWLEVINDPKMYISAIKLYPTMNDITVNVDVIGATDASVTLTAIDPMSNSAVSIAKGVSSNMIKLSIPNPKLWDPMNASPFLYDLNISLDNSKEQVMAYFGLREIKLGKYNRSSIPDTGPQIGVDRPGEDMDGYPIALSSSDYNLCWALCNETDGCKAWAYGVPGCDEYSKPMCWLKASVPGTRENKCRVSGAVAIPGSPAVRPLLNGKPLFIAGWLDQSFFPDGLYTAPTDDALKFDVQAVLDYGLNGVRLHQKVNPERWYYYADKLGVIVQQDAVQKYGGATNATIEPFMSDLTAMIDGKFNHPSIIQWETFNEGDCWSVFTNKSGVSVEDVVEYVQSMDPTRLVDTDSGGGANNYHIGDVNDVHDYPNPGDPKPSETQYAMIGEYGGIGYWVTDKEWAKGQCRGYKGVDSAQDYASLYVNMSELILAQAGDLSVAIYTQLTDIENECDGYVSYDRTAKWNDEQIQMVRDANQKMIKEMWN